MCYYSSVRMSSTNLLDLLPAEVEQLAESLGAPCYRGRQLASWIFRKGVVDLEAMSDLPREFRAALAQSARVDALSEQPAFSAALGVAIADIRAGRDATQSLRAARRAMAGAPAASNALRWTGY